MPMKVRYSVVDGEIVSEQRSGVKSFYVSDAIGSTIAVEDSTGSMVDRISYWPYGSVSSRMGSFETPFLYVGALGYYSDDIDRTYVRARNFGNTIGKWLTADPIGFKGGDWNMYAYVMGVVTSVTDPSGRIGELPSTFIPTEASKQSRPPLNPVNPKQPPLPPVLPPLPRPKPDDRSICEKRNCKRQAQRIVRLDCGLSKPVELTPCVEKKSIFYRCDPPDKATYEDMLIHCCQSVFANPPTNPMQDAMAQTMVLGCLAGFIHNGYGCCGEDPPIL